MLAASLLGCVCYNIATTKGSFTHTLIGIQNNHVSYAAHNRSKLLFFKYSITYVLLNDTLVGAWCSNSANRKRQNHEVNDILWKIK
jgi:hypothetical protein